MDAALSSGARSVCVCVCTRNDSVDVEQRVSVISPHREESLSAPVKPIYLFFIKSVRQCLIVARQSGLVIF